MPRYAGLSKLFVQQREDSVGRARLIATTFLVEHVDLGAITHVLHDDAILLGRFRRRAAATEQPREEAAALAAAVVDLRIDVAHEIDAFRAVAILDGEADAVEREADSAPRAIELLVQHEPRAVGRLLERGARRLRRRCRGHLRLRLLLLYAEAHHHPPQHLRFQLGIRGTRLPARVFASRLTRREPGVDLFHSAMADVDLGRARLCPALQPRAELVALGGRMHVVEDAPQKSANDAVGQACTILRPVRLHYAGFGDLDVDDEAELLPELLDGGPQLVGVAVYDEPALRSGALDACAVLHRKHRARPRRLRAATTVLLVFRVRGGARARNEEAIVAGRARQIRRHFQPVDLLLA